MRYINYLKPYIKYETMIFFLVSVSSVVALVNPVLLKVIIDRVLILKELDLLKYILGAFVAFYLLSVLIQFVSGYFNNYIGQMISIKIRKDLLKHINKVTIDETIESRSGDLISKVTDDVSTVTGFLTNTFVSTITYILNILASAGLMIFFNTKLAGISFCVAAVQLIISLKFSNITQKNQQEIRESASIHLSFLKQCLTSVKHIKSYGKEKYFEKSYLDILKNVMHLNFKNFYIIFTYSNMMTLTSFVGSLIIFTIGIYEIYNGRMSVGALFVFDMLSERFYQFATALANLNISLQGVIVSLNRLESIFTLKAEDYSINDSSSNSKGTNENSIRFENVTFSYKNQSETNTVLKDLSLVLKKGKAYALLGASGEGKSTITSLLLRLYAPDSGTIYLSDNDINKISLRNYRKRIGIVFQDSMLIDGTIEENIRYGIKNIHSSDIERVSKICLIDDFVNSLVDGYKTKVGEAGEKLSGGQKQRICLARALLRDSDIYIFDEALSNLDKKLENEIFNNLEAALSKKLRIYISHNVRLVKNLENLIIIRNGRVEAAGDHEKLINTSNLYKELFLKGENGLEKV